MQYDTLPWYRQFWPWFLIAIPLLTVVSGVAMILIASDKPDGLVMDDYYKQGLAINRRLERERRAAEMGLSATGRFEPEQRLIKLQMAGVTDWPKALTLSLIHPTQAHQDRVVTLQKQSSNGDYLGVLGSITAGDWHMMLEPLDKQWRLTGRFPWPGRADWRLETTLKE